MQQQKRKKKDKKYHNDNKQEQKKYEKTLNIQQIIIQQYKRLQQTNQNYQIIKYLYVIILSHLRNSFFIQNICTFIILYNNFDLYLSSMGRKRIQIKKILNPVKRQITFQKRKLGLLKKASEISILCSSAVKMFVKDQFGNFIQFFSDLDRIQPIQDGCIHKLYTNEHYPDFSSFVLERKNDIADRKESSNKTSNQIKIEETLNVEKIQNNQYTKIQVNLNKAASHDTF